MKSEDESVFIGVLGIANTGDPAFPVVAQVVNANTVLHWIDDPVKCGFESA